MTGPGLALIIIPLASTASLVAWLTMVFSADSHPRQADRNPVRTQASTTGQPAERLPVAAAAANRAHRGSGERYPPGSPAPQRDKRIASQRRDKRPAAT